MAGGAAGGKGGFVVDHARVMSDARSHLEQLVLYVRALQLLTSAMQLAQTQAREGALQSSVSIKNSESLSEHAAKERRPAREACILPVP